LALSTCARASKFQNGDPFTADRRGFLGPTAFAPRALNLTTRIAADAKVSNVDDYTVDFVLSRQIPSALPMGYLVHHGQEMVSRRTNSIAPTPAAATSPSFAHRFTPNGTAPLRSKGVPISPRRKKPCFKPNPNWLAKAPAQSQGDRLHADRLRRYARMRLCFRGEVDIIEPVPIQDISRVDSSPNAEVLKVPELRTIFLGMDQARDELLYSNVKGRNPSRTSAFAKPSSRRSISN